MGPFDDIPPFWALVLGLMLLLDRYKYWLIWGGIAGAFIFTLFYAGR